LTIKFGVRSSSASTRAGFTTWNSWKKTDRRVAPFPTGNHWQCHQAMACSIEGVCSCKRWPLWEQTVRLTVSQTGVANDVHIENVSTTVSFFKHLYLINSMRNFVENYKVYEE